MQLNQKEGFMEDQIQSREEAGATEISSVERVEAVEGLVVSQEQKKWTLKGMLMMALCCGAPLLLVAAVTLFGISLGAMASGALSLAVILACPVGMYLMMRMMNKM